MSNDDYFNFENEDRDFPFYKKIHMFLKVGG